MFKRNKKTTVSGEVFEWRKVTQDGEEVDVPVIVVAPDGLEGLMKKLPNIEITVVHMVDGVSAMSQCGKDGIVSVTEYQPKEGERRFVKMSLGCNSGIELISGSNEESATTEDVGSSEDGDVAEVDGSEAPEVNNANIYSESSSNYTWFVEMEIEENDLFIIDPKVDANSTKEMEEREESIAELMKSLECDAKASDFHEEVFTHEQIYDGISDLSGTLF